MGKTEASGCPIKGCKGSIQPLFGNPYSDLQNHLWQHHVIDVIESHRLAATVAAPPETKLIGRKVSHGNNEVTLEFKKRQMNFDFDAGQNKAYRVIRHPRVA